ncbi:DNA repair exonuclease SbcCD ATPase subunit [Anaerocolumna cellulosilytica]|nr:DNA repair exonuclease SbcCD ATPase subunit [Anaerocolumna cellulosilytica]
MMEDFENERSLLQEKMAEIINEKGQLHKHIERSNTMQQQAEQKILEYESDLKSKEESIKQRKQQVYRLEQKLYKLNQEDSKKAAEISRRQEEFDRNLKEVELLSDEVKRLNYLIRQHESEIQEVTAEKQAILNKMNQKETILNSVELALEKQKETSIVQVTMLEKQNKTLKEQTDFIQQLIDKNEELQQSSNTLENQLADLKQKEKEVTQLSNEQLNDKIRVIDELETQLLECMIALDK